MYTDFLLGVAQLSGRKDRVELLRLGLRLSDHGSTDAARTIYELCPYLSVDEKLLHCGEAMNDVSLNPVYVLATLTSCYDYLEKDEAAKRIRACIEILMKQHSTSLDTKSSSQGFESFLLQRGLATLLEGNTDTVSALADMARQEELLDEASLLYKGSQIWLARIRLARAWLSYSRALRTSAAKRLELFEEATKEVAASTKPLSKLSDYPSLFLAKRLLFLVDDRRFMELDPKKRRSSNLLSNMKRNAEQSVRAAENLTDPAKLAGAYTNAGVALRRQAEVELDLRRRRRVLLAARKIHLKAASTARLGNDEMVALNLYNAGADMYLLTRTEPEVVKLNDMLETTSREMDEVIRLSAGSTDAGLRASAIFVKLHCIDELSGMNPVTFTRESQAELDRLSSELENLQSKAIEKRFFADAYMNLSLHCLRLARAGGTGQKELVERAERHASKAYEIAEEAKEYVLIGLVLSNIASILIVKGILSHDILALDRASEAIEKSLGVLSKFGDAAALRSQSLATEIHIVRYGYTGDRRELTEAISWSSKSIAGYVSQGYFQLAAEEAYRLAELHVLTSENKKAEKTLSQASGLFKRAGKADRKFRKVYQDFAVACSATNRLIRAQNAYRNGHVLLAKHLAEEAEREMMRANARWREIWLIRGFKEIVSGNPEGAKRNLVRVIQDSADALEEHNPTTTGHTAKKLVSFIEKDKDRQSIPPTVIDLPLKSDVIVAALRLDRIAQQLSTVPSFTTYSEQQELGIEEIRRLIKRIMRIDRKPKEQ